MPSNSAFPIILYVLGIYVHCKNNVFALLNAYIRSRLVILLLLLRPKYIPIYKKALFEGLDHCNVVTAVVAKLLICFYSYLKC